MRLTFFGHAAFQIDLTATTLLLDPFITGNRLAEGVVTAADLHPDVILLTHAHEDHWGDTPAIATRTGALVVSCYEVVSYLGRVHGHENTYPGNTGGTIGFDWGRLTFTHARHSSSFPDGTYGGVANGFVLQADGKTLYVAGDTALFPDMAWIGQQYDLDAALLPVGDCFTMGLDDALKALDMLNPRQVVPIHYNTFPYIEVAEADLTRWAEQVADLGIQPHLLSPGDALSL